MCKRTAVTGLILLVGIVLAGCLNNEQPVASLEVSGETIEVVSDQMYRTQIHRKIILDASASIDPDGSVGSYHFLIDNIPQPWQASPILEITPDRIGVMSVRLVVEDNEYKNSCESCVIAQIAVEEEPTPCPVLNVHLSLVGNNLVEGENELQIDNYSLDVIYVITMDGVDITEAMIVNGGIATFNISSGETKIFRLNGTNDCGNTDYDYQSFTLDDDDPVDPDPLVYRLEWSNRTKPNGPNYTCHEITARGGVVSGDSNGPYQIYFDDNSPREDGLIATHYYKKSGSFEIQLIDADGIVVKRKSINITRPDVVGPNLTVTFPSDQAHVGDYITVTIDADDIDEEWLHCICRETDEPGHGIQKVRLTALYIETGELVSESVYEGSQIGFPITITIKCTSVGELTLHVIVYDNDCECSLTAEDSSVVEVTE